MKRLLALIMAMALIFCFAACEDEKKEEKAAETTEENNASGENNGGAGNDIEIDEPEELTADEVGEKTVEAMKEAKSVRAKMTAEMNMSAMGQDMNMTMSSESEEDVEAGLAHMDMNVETMGQQVKTEMYVEYSDTVATIYTNTNDVWTKQEVDMSALSSELGMGMDGLEGTMMYIESLEDMNMTKEGNTYTIEGRLGETKLQELMSSVMSTTLGDASEIPAEIIEEMIASMEDIKLVAYIDADTFLVNGIEMDMSDMVVAMFDVVAEYAGEEIEIDVAEYVANVEYYDYNADINIEIPEEAKAA
ncbi:MAG: hypothetical protein IJO09_00290 [Oscillospiraceae bacterium]|nr:hypothetical protein [Oscillospiraceae bacterium]